MLIGNNNYIYSTEVRDNDVQRASFNQLVRNTFGFDFTEWYRVLGRDVYSTCAAGWKPGGF